MFSIRTKYRAFISGLMFAPTLSVAALVLAGSVVATAGGEIHATDPSPVNPPGPIPVILMGSDGRNFEVFTPEQGGSIIGDDYSFVAVPGDVPSAVIIGIQMNKGGAASNAGFTHHRYTLGGALYSIDAVDEDGKTPSSDKNGRLAFRNPPVACVPIPGDFLSNITSARLIATDSEGSTQTVLNSGTSVGGGKAKICGHVGSVPATVAVGMEGSPAPIPPSPVVEIQVIELPVTGAAKPDLVAVILMLLLGSALVVVGTGLKPAHAHVARRANNCEPDG